MANTRAGNVLRVDTSALFTGNHIISSIRFIGTTGATANIKEGSSSGGLVWEDAGTSTSHSADVDIRIQNGFYVTVASGAVVYIYLE